jgi:hypothetical protein
MKRTFILSGIFQILVGIQILGIWTLVLLKGEVPEFATEPWNILMHIIAEFLTGTLLLLSGLIILTQGKKHWIFHLSLGALLYTLIASQGYYAHQGKWGIVAMFVALLLATLLILIFQKE